MFAGHAMFANWCKTKIALLPYMGLAKHWIDKFYKFVIFFLDFCCLYLKTLSRRLHLKVYLIVNHLLP